MCLMSYFVFYSATVSYLYVRRSGTITSVGEESANLSAIVYLWFGLVSSSCWCF